MKQLDEIFEYIRANYWTDYGESAFICQSANYHLFAGMNCLIDDERTFAIQHASNYALLYLISWLKAGKSFNECKNQMSIRDFFYVNYIRAYIRTLIDPLDTFDQYNVLKNENVYNLTLNAIKANCVKFNDKTFEIDFKQMFSK